MIAFHPASRRHRVAAPQLFLDTFRSQIAALESGRARIRVPRTQRLFERLPGKQYHFKPELFIQLGGATEFKCPEESFSLEPGEICVMPRGVPHGEVARTGSKPFENVVVCYYNETVAIHVAHESPPGRPIVDDIYFFTSPFFSDLVEYLNRVSELHFHQKAACDTAVKGLMLAELALLVSIVEERQAGRYSETEPVFRCQWLIRNNIDDSSLTVEALATELRCSPAHLSRLFHHQTGERIVEYITRIRLRNALDAIRQTELSVKEIAVACGFNDPNYFARVFRKYTGRSPLQYREDQQRVACAVETEPKVVYFDHEDRSFGLRPEVMAKASARMRE